MLPRLAPRPQIESPLPTISTAQVAALARLLGETSSRARKPRDPDLRSSSLPRFSYFEIFLNKGITLDPAARAIAAAKQRRYRERTITAPGGIKKSWRLIETGGGRFLC